MNNRGKGLFLALVFGVAIIIGSFVPSTLAYIMAKSDTLKNTFTAPYFPPNGDGAMIAVHKTVNNIGLKMIGPEGFCFALYNEADGKTIYMTTDETGYASVILPFADEHVGKTYTYLLSEVNDKREDVTYSEKVYTVTIDVAVNEDYQIVTSLLLDGKPIEQIVAEFENTYGSVILPVTGDNSQMLQMLFMLLAGCAGIIVLKRKKGCVN